MPRHAVAPEPEPPRRRSVRRYVKAPTLAEEMAEEAKWEAANKIMRSKPSTSDTPTRCLRCQERNDRKRAKCWACGAERAVAG